MYKNKLLFWISFVYYLASVFNILVAYQFIFEGEKLYFISFAGIFGIDKIILLIFMRGCRKKMLFWVCDTLQIGFAYTFFADDFFEDTFHYLAAKIPSRILP